MNSALKSVRSNGSRSATNGNDADARSIASLLPGIARQLFAANDDASDLPLAQVRVCGILHGGPQPMSKLGRLLSVSLSAMTQLADRLEKAGLVQRVSNGGDRRIRSLQLTPRGEKMMQEREAALVARVAAALEPLPSRTRRQIRESFQALMESCAALPQPATTKEKAG